MSLITLVIKSNIENGAGEYIDYKLKVNMSTSVKKIKNLLSEILTIHTKPSNDEMRLIYSGKLLKDENMLLLNVLRQFEGPLQETHTIHLVFTPKASSLRKDTRNIFTRPNTNNDATGSVRQRDNVQPPALGNLLPSSFAENSFGFTNNANGSANPSESMMAQQHALQNWMHQTYAQYMSQYMHMLSMGGAYNVSEEAAAQISYEPPRNILNNPPAVVQPDIAPQVNVNGQEPQQRRFPNIIQDEQQENRDWLDILYSMSRLMVLLCLVYFYSSPIRCLVVIMIGVALYFYHIYKQNLTRLNNNNVGINNNNLVAPQQQQAPIAENRPVNDTPEVAEAEPADQTVAVDTSTSSGLAFIRSFIMSFITSIVPDAPGL